MAVSKVLRDHCRPEWQRTHVASGELRDKRTAGKLKQMGVKPGWPDFILVPPIGQLHCLELKRIGNGLFEEQENFRNWCTSHGVPYSICHTLDEKLAMLDAWHCLRIKIRGPTRQGGSP